jgi:DNA-binding CsgD family transcriptional regulator
MKEYALYEGEEILAIGTVKEIADKLKISPDTVKFYGYAAYAKEGETKTL